MDFTGIRVVGDDADAVARLRGLLEFVGEPVREDINDVVIMLPDGAGRWPELEVRPDALVVAGDGTPPGMVPVLGRLEQPLRLAPLLNCLHGVHAWRRGRGFGLHAATFPEVVGVSDAMARVRAQMAKVCASDSTVLITGESGTGKEIVARALHRASPRSNGPFVPVNCGAIPADLLESELFGYERGAFTGAVAAKAGRFELANGGTLFLDEIGDMPHAMQVKLLRAIQERSFERVGGIETRRADVRIIAATHRDLEAMIAEGRFREDLYYRLNVFPIAMPPLRERPDDVEPLVYAIGERIRTEQRLQVRLTEDAVAVLRAYAWPGNVRELKNLLERLAIEYPGEVVTAAELPRKFHESEPARPAAPVGIPDPEAPALLPVNGLDLKDYLGRLERSLIEQALEDTNCVVARAADRLHIRRTTLVEKMRKYGIERA
ncbi:MAG TPA: sigma-54 dependent transcriptional regulator [Pseudomonadales bacterium]